MRILHIASGKTGGAALAAKRLCESQAKLGHDSKVMDIGYVNSKQKDLFQITKRKGLTLYQKVMTRKEYGVLTPYSLPFLDLKYVMSFKPDVVHIHNWYNILNYESIEEISQSYPIVFTLHDERLITGGCHNSFGCDRNLNNCKGCPATNFLKKAVHEDFMMKTGVFARMNNYAIAAPSLWMIEKAKKSNVFSSEIPINKIPNIITIVESENNSVNEDNTNTAFKLLFAAADLEVNLKGFSILRESFSRVLTENKSRKFTLTAVGARKEKIEKIAPNGLIVFRRPINQYSLQGLLKESSLLVVPSLAENSPNIIAEAQLVGTPVLANEVGGIPEMIQDQVTGFLTKGGSEKLAEDIMRVLRLEPQQISKISDSAKRAAIETYGYQTICLQYEEVYEKLMENFK